VIAPYTSNSGRFFDYSIVWSGNGAYVGVDGAIPVTAVVDWFLSSDVCAPGDKTGQCNATDIPCTQLSISDHYPVYAQFN
jgi:hypothetical protein